MSEQKRDKKGEDLRQELTMQIGYINGRNMTATIVWALSSDERTARVNAEIDRLLAELARTSIMNERNHHGSS